MDLDVDACADAMRNLVEAAQRLNIEVQLFREATGLMPQVYVNGYEFGDRVGVRLEGYLIDAHEKPAAKAEE